MQPAEQKERLPSAIVVDDEGLLVTQAKGGDAAAFNELVSRYERRIFRLAQNITRNREDAEDVMQEAFIKAYTNLAGFQGDSRFYTWLVRIAVNEALMKLRKRRPGEFSLDEPVASDDGDLTPRDFADWGPSPEQRYARSEMNEILTAAIEKLDPDFRIVFVLRDIEGMTNEEAAEATQLSLAAAKSRLHRARLFLRDRLTRHFAGKAQSRRDDGPRLTSA